MPSGSLQFLISQFFSGVVILYFIDFVSVTRMQSMKKESNLCEKHLISHDFSLLQFFRNLHRYANVEILVFQFSFAFESNCTFFIARRVAAFYLSLYKFLSPADS